MGTRAPKYYSKVIKLNKNFCTLQVWLLRGLLLPAIHMLGMGAICNSEIFVTLKVKSNICKFNLEFVLDYLLVMFIF